MKRLPIFAALLAMTFLLAACGGGQSGQTPAAPEASEAGQSQPEPTAEKSTSGGSTRSEPPTSDAPSTGPEPEQADRQDRQDGQDNQQEGYGVTTLDGERVSIGAGDDVTALFFMAGW